MENKQYKIGTRWVTDRYEVYEKVFSGWKFLGISKSQHPCHVMEIVSHDCDHINDIYQPVTELDGSKKGDHEI